MIAVHRAAGLASIPAIAHAFFGRKGGVSTGIFTSLNCGPGSSDQRDKVVENRRRAMMALSPDAQLVTLYQMHGNEAVRVTSQWDIGNAPRADAMATATPEIALGILTADCAPVLLSDPAARVIGAAHCGWKGVRSGVVESALSAMEALGANRARILAAIGPCISQTNYEVGADFRAGFVERSQSEQQFFAPGMRADHFQFDLASCVKARLNAAGVVAVEQLGRCTYAIDADFFSFRRATHRGEPDYGRQLSAIMLCK